MLDPATQSGTHPHAALAQDRAAVESATNFQRNTAQGGDALVLLQSLTDRCTPLVIFDPQYREVMDKLKLGNEGVGRQKRRFELPQMTPEYIDTCCREAARVLRPSGYLLQWVDTFRLCEAYHLRISDALKCVDCIAWDNQRPGQGHRSRRRGDYLLVLQKPRIVANDYYLLVLQKPRIVAKATWHDHGIPSRWIEKVDRKLHPHVKPIGLIRRLISAITKPNELVVDPAAGSFTVMHAAHELGRSFIGCDIAWGNEMEPIEAALPVVNQANKQFGFDFGESVCGYVEAQQSFRREPYTEVKQRDDPTMKGL